MQGFFYICDVKKYIYFLFILLFKQLNAQKVVIYGQDTICSNNEHAIVHLDFQNKGVPPYTVVYSIDNIPQDTINTSLNVYNIKTKIPGTYLVEYFSDAVDNGLDSISGSAFVKVIQKPSIQLFVSNDTISILSPKVSFQVISDKTLKSQLWDFGDGSPISNNNNPTHLYSIENQTNSGKYFLSDLVVEDVDGCFDTISYYIFLETDHYFWLPNSFSPNNDNKNDKFCLYYDGIRDKSFLFNVFSSDGSLVYSTKDIDEIDCNLQKGWTGKNIKSDKLSLSDVYIYKLYFQDLRGWKYQKYGKIILSL
ncbi:MAG: hypothetical protein CM15mP112_01200 [Flavobacteriales bacterium]|nr:MAG: hypothetical protein CM15mP112_01200 [Flavobacteriales bacterium]